ncbi:MAG: hypothetical protein H0V70_20430 [Ktedonobacteraceae bacterium]|nr:hypothetical protein [Ktedonobacteraceae bacterium]
MATKNRQATISINGTIYYTAQKAQEVLDMTYSGLKYQVSIGNIKSEIPKGRRQSYYRAKDVEQVATDLKSFSIHRRNKPTQFIRVTTKEEMEKCMEISRALFGSERGDIEKHMKIIKKNPDTYFMIKDEDQTIGYTAIWPVKPEKINNLLAQTIPVKISPEDIEAFKEGKNLDIYINVIGVKPGFTREEKRYYGSRLISGLVEVIISLGEKGISIGTIAARSNMPDGIRIMKGIGFTEIEPITPERRTFIINIKESGIPFVRKYKQALQTYQESHPINVA